MDYGTGEPVRVWDRVEPWAGCSGVVVASPGTEEYTVRYSRETWSHLREGILVDTTAAALIHYPRPDFELTLVARGGPLRPDEWAELRAQQYSRPRSPWRSGAGPWVQIGALNRHGQICTGTRGRSGTDHLQLAYRAECGFCGHVYGTNGSDMFERRCPSCQDGVRGLEY